MGDYKQDGLNWITNRLLSNASRKNGIIELREDVIPGKPNPVLKIDKVSSTITNEDLLKILNTRFSYYSFKVATRRVNNDVTVDTTVDVSFDTSIFIQNNADKVLVLKNDVNKINPSDNPDILPINELSNLQWAIYYKDTDDFMPWYKPTDSKWTKLQLQNKTSRLGTDSYEIDESVLETIKNFNETNVNVDTEYTLKFKITVTYDRYTKLIQPYSLSYNDKNIIPLNRYEPNLTIDKLNAQNSGVTRHATYPAVDANINSLYFLKLTSNHKLSVSDITAKHLSTDVYLATTNKYYPYMSAETKNDVKLNYIQNIAQTQLDAEIDEFNAQIANDFELGEYVFRALCAYVEFLAVFPYFTKPDVGADSKIDTRAGVAKLIGEYQYGTSFDKTVYYRYKELAVTYADLFKNRDVKWWKILINALADNKPGVDGVNLALGETVVANLSTGIHRTHLFTYSALYEYVKHEFNQYLRDDYPDLEDFKLFDDIAKLPKQYRELYKYRLGWDEQLRFKRTDNSWEYSFPEKGTNNDNPYVVKYWNRVDALEKEFWLKKTNNLGNTSTIRFGQLSAGVMQQWSDYIGVIKTMDEFRTQITPTFDIEYIVPTEFIKKFNDTTDSKTLKFELAATSTVPSYVTNVNWQTLLIQVPKKSTQPVNDDTQYDLNTYTTNLGDETYYHGSVNTSENKKYTGIINLSADTQLLLKQDVGTNEVLVPTINIVQDDKSNIVNKSFPVSLSGTTLQYNNQPVTNDIKFGYIQDLAYVDRMKRTFN
jgi:hypothetical protein